MGRVVLNREGENMPVDPKYRLTLGQGTGTIHQPYVSQLVGGFRFHHFPIRQISGAFFFLSLTVYRIA